MKRLKKLRRFLDLMIFFAMDYAQIEIRMIAQLSGDKRLIKLFKSGGDIHSLVGHDLTGWSVEDIKKDEGIRRRIKALHFAIVYGKKPKGIVQQLKAEGVHDADIDEITEIYNKYFETYDTVREFIDERIAFVEEHGYSVTMFGMRREIAQISDRNSYWANRAINSPIQGSAHQLVLIALALLRQKYKDFYQFRNIMLEVHDALYTTVPVRDMPKVYREGKMLMEEAVPEYVYKWFGIELDVPLVADSKAGFRLGAMKDYDGGDPLEFLYGWCEKNAETDTKIRKQFKKDYGIKLQLT